MFSACSDFLEETSQDEIIPDTLEDLSAVMYSEAYPYQLATDLYLTFLTDEMVNNGLNSDYYQQYYEVGKEVFKYNIQMFDGAYTLSTDVNSWTTYYEKIMGCNVVMDYLENISASESEKNAVKGQVLFLRGFYYLKLALIYCQPYNGVGIDPTVALGVPLVLTMDVTDDFLARNSLKETYDQIEKDLKESVTLLKENYVQPNKFRVGYTTAEAMLTRYYLLKSNSDDYQKIVDYSNEVLSKYPALTSLSSFEATFHENGIYSLDVSSEPLWVYGTSTAQNIIYWPYYPSFEKLPYSVSNQLISLYEANDLRAESYFAKASAGGVEYSYKSHKIGTSEINYGDWGIRNAEVYLNRAEAYCRLFIETGNDNYRVNALSDLNTLRESRYAAGTYEAVEITDAQELLSFCLEERRRELCLEEGLRWADIKRLNLAVSHVFIDENGNETTYSLSSGDLLYALPIPYDVINRNSKLAQNPR